MSGLYGNAAGGFGMPKTFVLVDDNNNEFTGVVVGEETVFTAELNDIRAGKIAANAEGVVTGTKDIPGYRTTAGSEVIKPQSSFSIPLSQYNMYDYTVLQCVISLADLDDMDNSVNTNMIVLNDCVYEVNSINKLSDVSKNVDDQSVDLNITNNTENSYVIYYFIYRQEV